MKKPIVDCVTDLQDAKGGDKRVARKGDATIRASFNIEQLLAAPQVPRGRRPNSKYPRVQACKSMSPFGVQGLFPLFPVTQPAGFVVKVADDDMPENNDVR